ncbi:hypothetical protein VUR80DRAFT_8674 [Thermomyces stellatus]
MKGNREAPTRQYWALISDDARQKRLGPTLSISSPRQGVTAPNGHTHKVEDRLQGLQGSECQVRRGPPLQPEILDFLAKEPLLPASSERDVVDMKLLWLFTSTACGSYFTATGPLLRRVDNILKVRIPQVLSPMPRWKGQTRGYTSSTRWWPGGGINIMVHAVRARQLWNLGLAELFFKPEVDTSPTRDNILRHAQVPGLADLAFWRPDRRGFQRDSTVLAATSLGQGAESSEASLVGVCVSGISSRLPDGEDRAGSSAASGLTGETRTPPEPPVLE